MKWIWCWRCKAEMPMMDDDEFRHLMSLRRSSEDDPRRQYRVDDQGKVRDARFDPVLAEYERLTGYHETNINAIFHHRTALYGPPCKRCGKPLRSPTARLCGACMHPVNT